MTGRYPRGFGVNCETGRAQTVGLAPPVNPEESATADVHNIHVVQGRKCLKNDIRSIQRAAVVCISEHDPPAIPVVGEASSAVAPDRNVAPSLDSL